MKRPVLVICQMLLLTAEVLPHAQIIGDTRSDGSELVCARLVYGSGLAGFARRRGGSSRPSWSKADKQLMFGIDWLSNVRIVLEKDVAVPIMDPDLFSYPFLYAVEVGHMELTLPEAARLREYMRRGGFLVVDDFWGTYEWQSFIRQIKMIFPDREVERLDMSHEISHSFYDIQEILQVPNVNNDCSGYGTSEAGWLPIRFGHLR
jgi:hypothetical protein